MRDNGGTLSEAQLEHLTQYFNEKVTFSRHIGAKIEEVEPSLNGPIGYRSLPILAYK